MKENLLHAIKCACSAIAAGILLSACTVVSELPKEKRGGDPNDPEYQIARAMLVCFVENDADGFLKDLAPEAKKSFTKAHFKNAREKVVKDMGEPVSFSYVDTLEMRALKPQIWKVRFRRENRDGTEEFFSEALFRVLTGKINNEAVILGFNFQ